MAKMSPDELQRNMDQLEAKAIELERREAELQQNEENNARKHISSETLAPELQIILRNLYYVWILNTTILIVNCIIWLVRKYALGDLVEFVLSLVYLITLAPASYFCWNRTGVKAFQGGSSIYFTVFFIFFLGQFVTNVLFSTYVVGVCGIVSGVFLIQEGNTKLVIIGIFVLVVGLAFAIMAMLVLVVLVSATRAYRRQGPRTRSAKA